MSSSMNKKKTAVIYYSRFTTAPGGSEYLPILFISALQKKGFFVTLALNMNIVDNLKQVLEMYNMQINLQMVNILSIRPENAIIQKMDTILPFYRTLQLKKLAKTADICISTANMFDFGKPANHVVYRMARFGDEAFIDYSLHRKPLSGFPLFKRKMRTFLAEAFLRPLLRVRSTRKILADQREHIYVPSQYVADLMRAFYGPFNCTVFYPPTIFEVSPMKIPRDPMRIIYLGRIEPEKKIIQLIEIAECARKLSGMSLEFHIAGYLLKTPYVRKIKNYVLDKPWIKLIGPVYGKDKTEFLLGGTYAIHAERDEAFGICVTEYLKAGCIPIVPDEGGTPEVVANPALTYHTDEDAANILVRLLTDGAFRQEQLCFCKKRAEMFSFERYMENQNRILNSILERSE